MKKKYTTDIHVSRLKKMLKRKNPCGLCPAGIRFIAKEEFTTWTNYPCKICRGFVEIRPYGSCPCTCYGQKRTIKLTYFAIEEYELDIELYVLRKERGEE